MSQGRLFFGQGRSREEVGSARVSRTISASCEECAPGLIAAEPGASELQLGRPPLAPGAAARLGVGRSRGAAPAELWAGAPVPAAWSRPGVDL